MPHFIDSDTQMCPRCWRASGWHDQYYGCEALKNFSFWSYRRPVGHSKSSAVLGGHAPMVEDWAFAPIKDGVILKSQAVSGFVSKVAAIDGALATLTE